MSTPSEEPTIHELVTRLAELEQAHVRLQEELIHVRAEQAQVAEEQTSLQTPTHPARSSRRNLLTTGLGVAAASVGVATMLELSGGTALAAKPGPGVFASRVAGTPAVKATGTSGADGVDATSDSGTGVSATSTSGTGLVATSSSGLAGHFTGDVSMDNNLNVAGGLSTGTLSSGAGSFASGVTSTPAVIGKGNFDFSVGGTGVSGTGGNTASLGTGGIGVSGTGGSGGTDGTGVFGLSTTGTGVHGKSSSGLAGFFEGNVQVNGNFSASGTKNFVQAHPTDPSREIVYVALEGGEAGTYVRGTGTLVNGKAVLALPEHFGLVTDNEDLTIQLTPRGEWLHLYLVELDTTQIVVREAQGKSGAFDYLIHGVRRGYEQHEVIRMKR